MYRRLLSAGARGKYVPELAIHHRIHRTRLRKSYYRRWVFQLGVYLAQLQRQLPEPVPHVLGIPRYHYGRAVRSFTASLGKAVTGKLDSSRVVAAELSWWSLAGLLYGRHFQQAAELTRPTDVSPEPSIQWAAVQRAPAPAE
jgi:hypothetical protein